MTFKITEADGNVMMGLDNITEEHSALTHFGKPNKGEPYHKDLQVGQESHYTFRACGTTTPAIVVRLT